MNTYWTEAAQLYLILHQSCFIKIIESQIWSSGSSEEHLFPEALLSLFLSGGMIFISHLLRSVYFFISQSALHCIASYVWIIYISSYKDILLRSRVTTNIYIIFLLYCYKDISDLHYKHQNFITFCSNKYQNLHQIAYFWSVWVSN